MVRVKTIIYGLAWLGNALLIVCIVDAFTATEKPFEIVVTRRLRSLKAIVEHFEHPYKTCIQARNDAHLTQIFDDTSK